MNNFERPRKALGQNFLQDKNICAKIVNALAIQSGDVVIEIGPGRGALTEHLLRQDCRLIVIEFDRDLAAFWRDQSANYPRLSVVEADALTIDFKEMLDQHQCTAPVKLIGNLPYNISSPLLFKMREARELFSRIVVMLQKEVVLRLAAESGNKVYGRLSVMMQQAFRISRLFDVAPGAFLPPPKVDSSIACLQPLTDAPNVDDAAFEQCVKAAFAQRRKTLRNTLKELLTEAQIESTGLKAKARAETLSVADFIALSEQISSNQ